ncbi:MAG: PilN domain-containing protein [Thiobacillaceae bacterium]
MSALGLDFARPRPRAPWWAWLLLALGLGAGLWMGQLYRQAGREMAVAQERLQGLRAPKAIARVQRRDPALAAERAARAEARRALDMPWGELLSTLQRTRPRAVALLGLEADARRGTLTLTAEARDYTDMIEYYAQLQSTPGLANVTLVQHGLQEDGNARPVRFVLRGRWGQAAATGEAGRE